MSTRRAAIYARISVTQEASVSIDRQVEAAQQYAAARGWEIVDTFIDDGVSATHNKPDQRAGWTALVSSQEQFDAVLVWKIDRLARRTIDFLQAHEALTARGAGIVSVEEPIDMTTAQGRAFATMLAVFAEMEAASISERVAAARHHLLRNGRVPGGSISYGWHAVPNPDGPGFVLAQDPERIEWVKQAVARVSRGDSIYSVKQWLDEAGAPRPTARAASWGYSTLERLLRNPLLGGMVPFNPGNKSKVRGSDVLRDDNGLPVVVEGIGIMTPGEWRALVKALDSRDSAQARPRALKAKTSALLSGLVVCGHCLKDGEPTRMWRGTTNKREAYYCPSCYQTLSNFEDYVVAEFMRQKGERVRWSRVTDVVEGGATVLPEIAQRIGELTTRLVETDDDMEAASITTQLANLRALRRKAKAEPSRVEQRWERQPRTFGEDWEAATDVSERRAVLDDALERIVIRRGKVGRYLDPARLEFQWRMPDDVGPLEVPSQEDLAAWADD